MTRLVKFTLLLAATVFTFSALSQPAPTPASAAGASPAASSNPEDAALEKHLRDGTELMKSGRSGQAINDHFDKVISAFDFRFKDDKRKLYTGRSLVDKMMYMLEAANSKEEPKRGAAVVSSLWSDAWYLKAYALLELKRISEAKSALESALALSPRHSQYLSELGNLYLVQRNWSLAFKTFEQAESAAKEFSPADVKNTELSRAWRGMGYVYIEQNRLDDAEKMYRQCLELDKTDQRAQGQLNYIQGQRARQTAALANVAQVQPSGAANMPSREGIAEPASPQLLDHLYKQLQQVENPSQTPGAMPPAFQLNDAQTQLRRLGARAWPLAPRVAELLFKTEKNQYAFAWILMEMVPPQAVDDASVNATLAQLAAATGSTKLVDLARLSKTNSRVVVPGLQAAANDGSGSTRLLATIGLGLAGNMDAAASASTLSAQLSDKERYVRSAAVNSLRLLGPRAEGAAPALINYLKTGESPYAATRALKPMPISYLRQARPEFEKILADTRLTDFQKTDATEIMIRLETEK